MEKLKGRDYLKELYVDSKTVFKETLLSCVMDSPCSLSGKVADSYGHRYDPWGSVKIMKFLDQLFRILVSQEGLFCMDLKMIAFVLIMIMKMMMMMMMMMTTTIAYC